MPTLGHYFGHEGVVVPVTDVSRREDRNITEWITRLGSVSRRRGGAEPFVVKPGVGRLGKVLHEVANVSNFSRHFARNLALNGETDLARQGIVEMRRVDGAEPKRHTGGLKIGESGIQIHQARIAQSTLVEEAKKTGKVLIVDGLGIGG